MKHLDLMGSFPYDRHPHMRIAQRTALEELRNVKGPIVLELPVGTGKTAIGYTYLSALRKRGAKNLFYIVPNKTLVEQVRSLHPEVLVAFGRNEHPCLYYEDKELKADEIPCSLLKDCPHRVDQETGNTHTQGAVPCPYLKQKYEARHSKGAIVACTNAFFLFTVLFSKEMKPDGVVVDEAHKLAQTIRSVLSTEITDWKVARAVDVLDEVSPRQCEKLAKFLASMKRMVKRHGMGQETLLEEAQLKRLYSALGEVNPEALQAEVQRAISRGKLDLSNDLEVLKQIEDITRSVRRFQHAIKFAIKDGDRMPLNFVFAFGKTEMGDRDRVQYKIVVKDYYVVPLITKILPPNTLAYSATISDPELFAFETGIKGTFTSVPSGFPVENARIYMPTDTANLSVKGRSKRDKTRMIRLIARSAKKFADNGHRSLVIVVSNEERQKFLQLAAEEGLDTLSYGYGNGMKPRECATRFREGEGDCLVGTVANFGEGLDLPRQTAPVIFCYRPGYPHPDDPQTVFEARRFRSRRWALWNWHVILEMLQVRGRNIRSETDLGVTFLISQQFRRFTFGSLPEWLQPAYRGQWKFKECVRDAEKLLDNN
jgi:Rad3-related DNA helicase